MTAKRRGRHRRAQGRAEYGGPGPGEGGELRDATTGPRPPGRWARGYGSSRSPRFHVVAYDFGVKRNILRLLASRGCRVTVVPAQTPAAEAEASSPTASSCNGPGDPEPCDYAIAADARTHRAGIPTFGICLGHQIMALASGAKTFKMKFGHHGATTP